jgi:hypothetical protein
MSTNIESYKAAAMTTFTQLKQNYGWSGNFWRLGHSFDTIIDYFDTVDASEATLFATEYVLPAFKKFTGHWYDDYGWWGLAALRASQRKIFITHAVEFNDIARDCWNFMSTGNTGGMQIDCSTVVAMGGAPKVWEWSMKKKADWERLYKRLEPRYDKGVWNCDWNLTNDSNDPCYCVPIWEEDNYWASNGLSGFQNTITNALYLTLAARLKAGRPRSEADREYEFLQSWFDHTPADESLLCQLEGTEQAYVRERVSVYMGGGAVYNYRPDTAWAGDQGVLLSGLVDYMALLSNDALKKKLRGICKQLIGGTKRYFSDADGILLDWRNPSDRDDNGKEKAPGDDPDDYRTGSGAYMRFLTHAYRNDPELKQLIETDEQQKFIARNADAIDLFPKNMPIDLLVVVLTNNLAKLIAAIVMLKR